MLIVGLGNPDRRYDGTYHNIGFAVIDKLLDRLGERLKREECKALDTVIYRGDEKIVIAKPMTYMNLSGEAVRELAGKYRVPVSDILIIYDDIDLPCGGVRVRREGSAGTHNGMRNIVSCMKSTEIPRVRVGIGRPEPPMQLADYVLSHISGENADRLTKTTDIVARAIADYIGHRDFDRLSRECR